MKKKIAAIMLALGMFMGLGAAPAVAHQGWCTPHYTPVAGPGTYFHTTGGFVSGTDYKITIVQKKVYGPGYWYWSVVYSFRTDCR